MARRLVIAAALCLLASSLFVATVGGSGLWREPQIPSIGIKNVYYIGNTFGEGGPDSTVLRVFMPTGSSSEACLATMGEANHAPTVDGLYCSSRYVTLPNGRMRWGVLVTVILPEPLVDVDGDPSWYSLNVYQEGARFFGDPIRCDLPGC